MHLTIGKHLRLLEVLKEKVYESSVSFQISISVVTFGTTFDHSVTNLLSNKNEGGNYLSDEI